MEKHTENIMILGISVITNFVGIQSRLFVGTPKANQNIRMADAMNLGKFGENNV
jgi:hypothetical protein